MMVHFFALTAIAMSSAVASSTPVEWQADYGKALAATRADDRPLLVVLDVPSDPKTTAEDTQLKTDGEQAKLLASYQLCHIDASTKYGQKVAKAFHANEFPFTAIIDKTGLVVLHKKQGPLTDAQWHETLSAYKQGERPQPLVHSTAYRGETIVNDHVVVESPNYSTDYSSGSTFSYPAASSSVISPSYCPSCQRNAQQSF